MKLSDEVLRGLAQALLDKIKGGGTITHQDCIERITDFFLDMEGLEESDCPPTASPIDYMFSGLDEYRRAGKIKDLIEGQLSARIGNCDLSKFNLGNVSIGPIVTNETKLAIEFQQHLKKDGYKLIAVREKIKGSKRNAYYYRVLDKKEFVKDIFKIKKSATTKKTIEDAEKRFAEGDYPAAVDECFILVESVIKNMIKAHGKKPKGNFKAMYSQLSEILDLKPKGENIESYLKEVLQGLIGQVSGLYNLGNKAGKRHPPEFIPKRQDAKLAMNAAFTLCEYLQDAHKAHRVMPEEFATLAKITGVAGGEKY